MKVKYNKPEAELLQELLTLSLLDGSVEGDLSSYGDESSLTW